MSRSFVVATLLAGMVGLPPLSKLSAVDPLQKDIVETAVAAEFKSLVKAVQTAGMVDTLKGKGPLTVFAPTDKAFAEIPEEKLAALLKDKKALTAVLTYHVVPGKVMAADVAKLNEAKTVQGQKVKIEAKEGKVRINDANVVKADIACSNGVIHVIDAVLLPPTPRAAAAKLIDELLSEAEESKLREANSAALKATAVEILRLTRSNVLVRELLDQATATVDSPSGPAAAALPEALREAAKILRFEPTSEAAAPAGFPSPTPVGEIELKSYPGYRLARTAMPQDVSNDTAFFALFRHITSNGIEMTAPVEMTYESKDEDLRPQAMAFLYETSKVGQIGKQGEVNVVDMPAMTVVSLGLSGDYTGQRVANAKALLEKWLREHPNRYEPHGDMRVMGHNSPMVPVEKRYFEVQIPVREITRQGEAP